MATGKRLLSNSMPNRYKQGTLYPVWTTCDKEKNYGNRKCKNAGKVRKMGQNKVRKQLKKELITELNNT